MSNKPLLECKKIRKRYGIVEVLKGIDFTCSMNESVCILGISGSGKTTLLNIIAGLSVPTVGTVLVNNIDLYGNEGESLRVNNISMIFQEFELFDHYNALENVIAARMFQSDDISKAQLDGSELLHQLGLGEHIYKLSHQLSSGQKQRVGIARALINNPSLIIADEPTGSLDVDRANEIMNILCNITKDNHTLIYSTHNVDIAKFASRVLMLKDGLLQEIDKSVLYEIDRLKDLYVY